MVRTQIEVDDELFCWQVVPAWERSFGIQFAPGDFANTVTVGQVWAVVEQRFMAKFGEIPSGLTAACATRRTFYRVRRTLMARDVARETVAPSLPLAVLFPAWNRPRRWRQWRQESQLPLPALRTPAWWFIVLWALATVAAWNVMPGWGAAVATGLCTALTADALGLTRRALPADTLGELTKQMVATDYRALTHPALHNQGEMRDIVLAGLARCGVEEEEISPAELYDGTKLICTS